MNLTHPLLATACGIAATAVLAWPQTINAAVTPLPFPGRAPGVAQATSTANSSDLANDAISAGRSWAGDRLRRVSLVNQLAHQRLPVPDEAFLLEFRDGRAIRASDFTNPYPQREVAGWSGVTDAGKTLRIALQPFEVLVFEAAPVR